MTRTLPDGEKLWSLEAEAAVLASMIIDSACVPEILAVITKTDMFFQESHRIIFDALVDLHISHKPTDAVALRTQLKTRNALEQVGGVPYLARILDSVPSAANAAYYAGIVKDRYVYRQVVLVADQIHKIPQEPGTVNEQILNIQALALGLQPVEDEQGHSFEKEMAEAAVAIADAKGNTLTTGFLDVDRIIQGFRSYELILLAGRPGMGKSALALDIAMNVTKCEGAVVFVSLEMSGQALMQRAACSQASVNPDSWPREGAPPADQFNKLCETAGELQKRDMVVYETLDTPEKIYAMVNVRRKTTDLNLIIIDNIQIMTTEPYLEKETARLTTISRCLKRMAVSLKVPILAISHLNRQVTTRTKHIPRLSDLRGSGTLEQDSDLVLLLHRDDEYRKLESPDIDPDKMDGCAKVIVAKNRRGQTGIATLVFRLEFSTFANLSHQQTFEDEKGGE